MIHAFVMMLLLGQVAPTPPPVLVTPSAAPVSSSPSASPAPSPTPVAPMLIVSPTSVNLNPAQQAHVTLSNATGAVTATLDHALVGVTVDDTTHIVTLTATSVTGSDILHLVDAAGARADVPIRVAFNAGTIPATATLQVTGNPASPDWLAQQIASLVGRLVSALPGATTTVAPVAPLPSPLPPSAQTAVSVPVQIAGNGLYFDQNGAMQVTVQNVPLAPYTPAYLFFNDDPESVTQDGVLYRGAISAAAPVRLYYYHELRGDPRRLVVMLTSNSQDPTSVQVRDASAGPNVDVMSVGHAVSRDFLLQEPRNESVILNLPQDDPYELNDVAMASGQVAAGSIGLRILSGGPVTLTVIAASPGASAASFMDQPLLPGDGHHRTGVYALADFGTAMLSYTAGGANASVIYGGRAPTPPNVLPAATGHDYGDYGVMHSISFTLSNPTAAPATAYLYERPLGGVLRSNFLVDGSLIQVGCVSEPQPYQIAAYALAPGGVYRVFVQTMTDGGSNYPIEVGMSATPPQPTTPAISAPDGCFPKVPPPPV